jgi:aminoglycoside phosphotransferase (APT) family kinase protein
VPAIDPRDPDGVAAALRGWAADRFGGAVAVVGAPAAIGAGFDSYIHLVHLAGEGLPPEWCEPVVVRLLPTVDRVAQSQAEADVQGWCAAQGYAAPVVHAVLAPDELFGLPAQVMERAPGVTLLDALKRRPWRLGALVGQLVGLQLRLHAMDPGGWPGPTDPRELVERRLNVARRAVDEHGDVAMAAALDRVGRLVPTAVAGDIVVCHGDFHPLNVMVDGASAMVIDWTDAGLAPREADVARTVLIFKIAAIAAEGRVERRALQSIGPLMARRYERAYVRTAGLDPARMRAWEAIQALQGWAQIVTLRAGGFDGESSSDQARVPSGVADFLQARVEAALAG